MLVAATNTPWDLDEAIRRRLEKRIYIPLPDIEGRCELFKINMKSVEMDPDVDFRELAERSEGYSGKFPLIECEDAEDTLAMTYFPLNSQHYTADSI